MFRIMYILPFIFAFLLSNEYQKYMAFQAGGRYLANHDLHPACLPLALTE